jgi:hypothetical protein
VGQLYALSRVSFSALETYDVIRSAARCISTAPHINKFSTVQALSNGCFHDYLSADVSAQRTCPAWFMAGLRPVFDVLSKVCPTFACPLKGIVRSRSIPEGGFVGQPCYSNRQEHSTQLLTKDIKPIYVRSAARFKRASESATLSCSCLDPKCSHIQPHHTGEMAKSQPNETCVVELGSAVQVR